jgi:hypothetical protein
VGEDEEKSGLSSCLLGFSSRKKVLMQLLGLCANYNMVKLGRILTRTEISFISTWN